LFQDQTIPIPGACLDLFRDQTILRRGVAFLDLFQVQTIPGACLDSFRDQTINCFEQSLMQPEL